MSPEVGLKLHLVIPPPPDSVLGPVGKFEGISKFFFVINRISSPSYTHFLFIPVLIFCEKLTLQYKRKPPKLHEKPLILLATRSGLKSSPFPQARGEQPFQLPAPAAVWIWSVHRHLGLGGFESQPWYCLKILHSLGKGL